MNLTRSSTITNFNVESVSLGEEKAGGGSCKRSQSKAACIIHGTVRG